MPKVKKQTPKKKVVKKVKRSSKSGGVLERIESIGFDGDEGIKIILYGKSGTGKTTLWATFPKPILAIICSGTGKSDELRSIDTKENRKVIKQVALHKSEEVSEIAEAQASGELDVATIVVDHITGLQDMVLKEILGLDELPPQGSWGQATQQQYGQCTLQLKTRLRQLFSLDCNVVCIAQERTFEASENSSDLDIAPTIGAALSPSATGWLNTAGSYICQTFIRQKTRIKTMKIAGKNIDQVVNMQGVDYCLRTGPNAVYTTKFRMPKEASSKLPDILVNPDYLKIKSLIDQGG